MNKLNIDRQVLTSSTQLQNRSFQVARELKQPMKATTDNTSLKNKRYLRNIDYFAIIVFCSHSVLFSDKLCYRWTGMIIVELNIENERFTVVCSRYR